MVHKQGDGIATCLLLHLPPNAKLCEQTHNTNTSQHTPGLVQLIRAATPESNAPQPQNQRTSGTRRSMHIQT